jgi:hypothetical protein
VKSVKAQVQEFKGGYFNGCTEFPDDFFFAKRNADETIVNIANQRYGIIHILITINNKDITLARRHQLAIPSV